MKSFNHIFDYLLETQQTDVLEYLKSIWKAEFEDDNLESNLTDNFFKDLLPKLKMSEQLQKELKKGLSLFEDLPFLKPLLHLAKNQIENGGKIQYNKWPIIDKDSHPYGNLLGSYLIINCIPDLINKYEQKKWPLEYCYDILEDISLWLEDHHSHNNIYHLKETGWISNHFAGNIFQIGRLQFEMRKDYNPFNGYVNKTNGTLALFVNDGQTIRSDGQFNGTNNISDQNSFTTTFSQDREILKGHLINPKGIVEKIISILKSSEWDHIIKEEANYLAVHIPASGPITPDKINLSFEEAIHFFEKSFPDFKFDYFGTKTWFMDNQLEQYLPGSNIVKWQQGVYLAPIPKADEKQCYERVFGSENIDIHSIETTSSLQKVIQSHVQNGGHWRNSFFYLLKKDIPLKKNHYRKQLEALK
ncbi:MAG: hypothetical protein COA79_18340 [Planctomycetota bacterium]|nr:MAG: hypothetical protein COA79_18340 [Planctomycetota bacterium]